MINKIRPYIQSFFKRADISLLVICLICAFFGTAMVFKASSSMVAAGWEMDTNKQVLVQIVSIFLGTGVFVVLTIIDADLLGDQWRILVVFEVLLLVALVLLGEDDGTGNKSWIRFAGIGIQPSEFIKIMYIVVSARQMTYLKEHEDINSLKSVVYMVAHLLAVFGAIFVVSSDLGSASIILLIFLAMFFALGVKLYWFALGGAAVASMIPLLWDHVLKGYQKKRLLAPYDPSIDPTKDGINWQTTQSRITLASGRLTGVDSEHRLTAFTGKHTDFIFSCIGEELGMIGCILVIVLLLVIVIHCARVGINSGRTFDMLICIGVASSVAAQMFVNIGMCIGITPVIGITLPFFSYGGSSMMAMLGAMGLVSGVKFKLKPKLFSIY